jgi:ABC-type amino acid transport substrate-binding protein
LQDIVKSGYLKVGVYYEDIYPFFIKSSEGNLTGYDIELAKDIGEKLGVEVVIDRNSTTFNELVDRVAKNDIDVAISMLSATLDRAKKVLFTNPYVVLSQGLFFNRVSMTKIKSRYQEDWSNILTKSEITIGTISGTAYEEYARETFPNAHIKTYREWGELVEAVIDAEVDCAYYDEIEIKKLIKQNPNLAIKGKTIIIKDISDPIAMAVGANNFHLWQWLNLYLSSTKKATPDMLLDRFQKDLP